MYDGDNWFIGIQAVPGGAGADLCENRAGVTPVVCELVRRGTRSLPGLLAHLEDGRSTKQYGWYRENSGFLVNHEGAMSSADPKALRRLGALVFPFLHQAGVDLRHFDKIKRRETEQEEEVEGWRYTMKVGDLCYFSIGQIVNRPLHVISPSRRGGIAIHSPVHTSEVARNCRQTWGSLVDPETHKQSLINDGFDSRSSIAPLFALTRLHFYYPEEGEQRIVDHIRKPFLSEAGLPRCQLLCKL